MPGCKKTVRPNYECQEQPAPKWHQAAVERLDTTLELEPFQATCLYDWPNADEHWQWVATAPVAEIVGWARSVEQHSAAAGAA